MLLALWFDFWDINRWTPALGGGGDSPYSWSDTIRVRQYEAQKLKEQREAAERAAMAKEQEIAALEKKRLSDLANVTLQKQLLKLLTEANELELENQKLQALWFAFLREEDEIFVLLSTLPFMA